MQRASPELCRRPSVFAVLGIAARRSIASFEAGFRSLWDCHWSTAPLEAFSCCHRRGQQAGPERGSLSYDAGISIGGAVDSIADIRMARSSTAMMTFSTIGWRKHLTERRGYARILELRGSLGILGYMPCWPEIKSRTRGGVQGGRGAGEQISQLSTGLLV